MLYLFTGKPRPEGYLYQELIIACFALLVVGPITYWVTDRTPPQVRLRGVLVQCPDVDKNNNGNFDTCYVPSVITPGDTVRVKYWTTKRSRPDCPGTVQQEIISSRNTIFSKFGRPTGPAKWGASQDNPDEDFFIGQEVVIPEPISGGPSIFRSVTFRYCNWLQRALHWPIVQTGPDIPFVAGDSPVGTQRER